jgi:lipid-A-disaccharide synthase-like uncharacterized protein
MLRNLAMWTLLWILIGWVNTALYCVRLVRWIVRPYVQNQ